MRSLIFLLGAAALVAAERQHLRKAAPPVLRDVTDCSNGAGQVTWKTPIPLIPNPPVPGQMLTVNATGAAAKVRRSRLRRIGKLLRATRRRRAPA
jgi:hypothetical protein